MAHGCPVMPRYNKPLESCLTWTNQWDELDCKWLRMEVICKCYNGLVLTAFLGMNKLALKQQKELTQLTETNKCPEI